MLDDGEVVALWMLAGMLAFDRACNICLLSFIRFTGDTGHGQYSKLRRAGDGNYARLSSHPTCVRLSISRFPRIMAVAMIENRPRPRTRRALYPKPTHERHSSLIWGNFWAETSGAGQLRSILADDHVAIT
ncbi:hypothetical protein LY78DRAFT_373370 [Colletotrichum sublineola]|nr:hypothetical protein LY78DRAFT_373370 [Colletotrichum sublineola]